MATIAGAAIVITIGTFFNILFNAVKAIIIAKYFGTGPGLDAFFIAIILPVVVSGIVVASIQSSIIPVLIEYKTKGQEEEGYRIFHSSFTLSLLVFILVSLLMILFSGGIISLIAPGFKDERHLIASNLMRIVAPVLFIGGISDLIGALFNVHKKFAIPAFGGAINVLVSLAYLLLFKSQGVFALAIGLLAGSSVQCIYTVLMAIKGGLKLGISFHFKDPGVKKVFHVMVPMLLGTTFSNLNLTIDQIMASVLPAGSVSALNYAKHINDIVAQLFIFSIGSAILPFFSQQIAEGKIDELKNTFSLAVRMAFFLLMPITVFIFVLGTPVIQVVLQRGAFDYASTLAVAGALKAFAVGLTIFGIGMIAVKVLTSLQMTKILTLVAFVNVFINIALNAILMRYMAHVGIALSTSITYFCALVLLVYFMKRAVGKINFVEMFAPAAKVVIISAVSGIAVYGVAPDGDNVTLLSVCLSGAFAVFLYAFLSWIGKAEELRVLFDQLKFTSMRS